MDVNRAFSPADRAAIEAAVREAEAATAGEIVPYVVDRSDAYASAYWTAATLGALVAALAAAVVHELAGVWGGQPALWISGPPSVGAALGYLAAVVFPAFRRALVPHGLIEHRVHQRALAAFVEQEVFRTRDRTGILILLSLLERRVVVLADSGITARVAQAEWDGIVAGIVAGMRRRESGRALAEGIRRCGALLAAHTVPHRPDDRDELSDELRQRPE